jgi:iron complex outermembrane recepter protein
MRLGKATTAFLTVFLGVMAAAAQSRQAFDIPAQALDSALLALGHQAQISIGGIDPGIAAARSPGVRGAMSIERALEVLLRDTGYVPVFVDAATVRIQPAMPGHVSPRPASTSVVIADSLLFEEVVIAATKQQVQRGYYAGTVNVEQVGGRGLAETVGSAALVARLPILASTHLGPGRNKIFVRGIADSSFSGPTQSTTGLYLGDLRLTYNAPEPDLRLYDIDRIEVLEGPQGTLYGAGTLGGVVRIVPREPDMTAWHAAIETGVAKTQGASLGFDVNATANLPLATHRLALRTTAYRQRLGGATSNSGTGASHTDDTRVQGLRSQLRFQPAQDWSVDLGAVVQYLETLDAHYAERDQPARTRSALVTQPHENDFRAINLGISKLGTRVKLVSDTGLIRHDLVSVFDATGFQGQTSPLIFRAAERIRLITHETRLSYARPGVATAVLGISLLDSKDRAVQLLGPPSGLAPITALENSRTEAALFGEATRSLTSHWAVTAGARLAFARSSGELLGEEIEAGAHREDWRLLPTAALSWKPRQDLIAFLRYQSGFRSGGIAISEGQLNAARRFAADAMDTIELGMRFGDGSQSRFAGSVTATHSSWRGIQADLLGSNGLPYTDNIGHGSIAGIEVTLAWQPVAALSVATALFVNDSALRSRSTAAASLPNIPKLGAFGGLFWTTPLQGHRKLELGASARYTGVSRLGTVPPLILEQGETLQADLKAALVFDPWRISVECSNLLNAGGNEFSYGNPFSVRQGKQVTPQQPRTVRLGLSYSF